MIKNKSPSWGFPSKIPGCFLSFRIGTLPSISLLYGYYMVIIWLMMVNIYIYISGWWLVSTPLKMMEWVIMILPNWMESHKIPWFQTTNQNLTSEKSMVCLSVIAKIHIFSQWFLMISPFLAATSWQFPRHSPGVERAISMWKKRDNVEQVPQSQRAVPAIFFLARNTRKIDISYNL